MATQLNGFFCKQAEISGTHYTAVIKTFLAVYNVSNLEREDFHTCDIYT